MFWTNVKRVSRLGFLSFWRNGYVTLASVLTMTVALTVIALLMFSQTMLKSTLNTLREKVDINVYFVTSASEEEIMSLQKKIKALPEVSDTIYSSREEELEKFKTRHEGDELTLQTLNEIGDNPLGATISIKAKDPGQYEGIATFLETQKKEVENSIIDKINYSKNKEAINSLSRIMTSSRVLGLAIVIFFVGIAILITFNTIRLTIYMAREEISVMRLVGASMRYIKGPFVVGGLICGFASALLTAVILIPITYWAGPYTYSLGTGIHLFGYYMSYFPIIFAILLTSGLLIGAISSYFAVHKYLKV